MSDEESMSEEQYEALFSRVCSQGDISYNTQEDQILVREDVARDLITMTGGASEPKTALTLETLRQAINTIQNYPATPSPAMDRWRNETLYGQGIEAMSWPTPDRESSWDQHHLSPVDVWYA